jgi:hypothetical protein
VADYGAPAADTWAGEQWGAEAQPGALPAAPVGAEWGAAPGQFVLLCFNCFTSVITEFYFKCMMMHFVLYLFFTLICMVWLVKIRQSCIICLCCFSRIYHVDPSNCLQPFLLKNNVAFPLHLVSVLFFLNWS